MTNPYEQFLDGGEPLRLLHETPEHIRTVAEGWPASAWTKSYAPGKWTAAQVMLHLAQSEVLFGYRAIQALATDHFVVQPMDQDRWMAVSPASPNGPDALRAYLALRALNLALFTGLTPAQRTAPFTHPQSGTQTVDLIMAIMAGHEVNHLRQLRQIA